jgi:hypothetical protein
MPCPGSPAASRAVPSPAALSPGERLRHLAAALDAALAESPPGHPMALFLREPDSAGDGFAELGWLDLGERDPVDALLGFTAPPDWHAMGLACSGRAATLAPEEPVPRAARRPRPEPVRVVVFLDRAGRSTTVLRRGGRSETLDEAPEGLLGDCLRRALGLPTAAPPPSSARFWVAWWLDRVVASLVEPHGPPEARLARRTWPAVAALHPATTSSGHEAVEPSALVAATQRLGGEWPWGRLRAEGPPAAGGGTAAGPPCPPPDVAAWMDDGMYARWCTGAVADLLDTCHHLLTPEAWACVAAAVTATSGTGRSGGSPAEGAGGPAGAFQGPAR